MICDFRPKAIFEASQCGKLCGEQTLPYSSTVLAKELNGERFNTVNTNSPVTSRNLELFSFGCYPREKALSAILTKTKLSMTKECLS